MFAHVRRRIASGLTSSAPVAVAASSRSSLSALPRCFVPFVVATRQRRRLHDREHLPDALLSQRSHRRGDRAVVPDPLGGGNEDGGDVTVDPNLLVSRIGRAEIAEGDVAVGNTDAHRVELAVTDTRRMQQVHLAPQRVENVIADLLGGQLTAAVCRPAAV